LELTNRGSTPVYYRALDPLSLALSDRIPCLEPGRCPGVDGQSRVTIPYHEAIVGYRLDTARATVFWWHLLPQPDGSVVADEVRSLDLRL
jgi:hypothetical protein